MASTTLTTTPAAALPGFCTLCRSRCGTLNHVQNGKLVAVEALAGHPTGRGTCAKGRAAPELVNHPERILYPLKRTRPKNGGDPGWKRISWEEALTEIADRLNEIHARGAERVAFAVTTPSGTPLSDSIDWVERFIRSFGSPNTIYGTEICNWHKDVAHTFTFGCGTPNADYANARLNVLWGHNPSHVWLSQAGELGVGQQAGARLLVIDPRETPHARQADLWLAPHPGTDGALALSIAHQLILTGRFDVDFIRLWSNACLLVDVATGRYVRDPLNPERFMAWHSEQGAPIGLDNRFKTSESLAAQLALEGEYELYPESMEVIRCRPAWSYYRRACAEWPLERAEQVTGVKAEQILRAVTLIGEAGDAVSYHGWTGIGQHTNATQTERAIATLYALTGSFDRPGGNRRWSTPPSNSVNGLELMPEGQREKALGLGKRPLGPAASGWVTAEDVYAAIESGVPYPIEALFCFGGNMLVSQPEAERGERALAALNFHVHCDLFHTPTNAFADILLPVNTPWEREGLRIGFEINAEAARHVQLRPAMVSPRGESRADYQIALDLGCRLGMAEAFFHGDIEQGWNHMLAPMGLDVATLRRRPEGIRLPLEQLTERHTLLDAKGHCQGFATLSRRVELYSQTLAENGYPAVPSYVPPQPATSAEWPLTLITVKNGYYCHSQQRQLASLRSRAPEPSVSISPALAKAKGLVEGAWAEILGEQGSAQLCVKLDENLSNNLVVAEYGWWQACHDLGRSGYALHGPGSANINAALSARRRDPLSGALPLRSAACDLRPAEIPGTRWSGFRPMRISAKIQESEDVTSLWLTPSSDLPLPSYLPGQHATFRFSIDGAWIERTYSLSGAAPAQSTSGMSYRISVRRSHSLIESPSVSQHIHDQLQAGMEIGMKMPGGNFTLPLRHRHPLVLIAGGIGITPFLSLLETLDSQGAGTMPSVTLLYANRSGQSHAFRERLKELCQRLPRLQVLDVYSEPSPSDIADGAFDHAGIVDEQLLFSHVRHDARVYLCGPTVMMDALRGLLVAQGILPFEIFHEAFSAPSRPVLDAMQPRRIHLARSQREFVWQPQHGSLLESAEKQGIQLPSGCRVGQCESCSLTLMEGDVHVLVDTPAEEGRCLTCQSVPLTDLSLDA
ncbi:molybdopterin-dependent oxidoreductase [Vreelandella glaciei]|uniref:molybdopterin-dependent oxidoreductase n=1 Tax=Vreelandella glaciei TaxID=186761 RepID=UPI0030EC6026|tara:strand:- start:5116 stop:8532 length:3417 start_codon:yes stop_codon:yes gene_type:complete